MSEFTKNVQQWVMTGLSILGEVFSEKQTAGQKHAISLLLSGQADSALRAVCYYVMSNQIYPPSEEALQHPMVTDAVERLKVSVTMCGLANMQPSWAAEYVKTRSTTTDIHKPAPEGFPMTNVYVNGFEVDVEKERELFEEGRPVGSLQCDAKGEYIYAPTKYQWEGWLERAKKQVRTTLESELWKNPLLPIEERIEIADGAIAWRNDVIANLRKQLENIKPPEWGIDIHGVTGQMEIWYKATFDSESAEFPSKAEIMAALANHPLRIEFNADDRLQNMISDLSSVLVTSEFQMQLAFRQPLRRALKLCKEAGYDVKIDLGN